MQNFVVSCIKQQVKHKWGKPAQVFSLGKVMKCLMSGGWVGYQQGISAGQDLKNCREQEIFQVLIHTANTFPLDHFRNLRIWPIYFMVALKASWNKAIVPGAAASHHKFWGGLSQFVVSKATVVPSIWNGLEAEKSENTKLQNWTVPVLADLLTLIHSNLNQDFKSM